MPVARRTALWIFALCAAPRLVVLALSPPPELTFYWSYATNLLDHGTFGLPGTPDTQVEPLFPAFLAALRYLTGDRAALVLLAQIGIASIGGVMLHRLATSLTGDLRAAWFATLLYAFDPYLVRQSIALMEVTLVTALLIAVVWSERLPSAKGAALAGAFTGLAVLTRFSLAPLVAAIPLLLARRSPRAAILATVVALVLIAPWSVRNYRVDGSIAPSRVGINLSLSLSDAGEQLLPKHNADRLVPLVEEKPDRELFASAIQWAREHPWRTVKMKARNFLHVFNPRLLPYWHEPPSARVRVADGRYLVEGSIPRPATAEWVHAACRFAVLALAVVGVYLRGIRWEDGALWAIVLTITTVCTVFFPTTRLTTPMVFSGMMFAAVPLARTSR